MPWPSIQLFTRRAQVRDQMAYELPGADATVPNSVLRGVAEAQAALTHDNDRHLDWLARMMMPDTAEGEFAERWGGIWLPDGRKPATSAAGLVTVTGAIGAVVPTDTVLIGTIYATDGTASAIEVQVASGVTLSGPSAVVPVLVIAPGASGNLDEGARLAFRDILAGVDGTAVVAAPGLAGGADQETDADLIARYIARIQEPPHGGARHDYVAWALEVPGITRAWSQQEMGVGTVTVRVMLDLVRADDGGLPSPEDLAVVAAYLDSVRPITVAQLYVAAPVAQPLDLTIDDLVGDTPEVRANIAAEISAMLRARAAPGQRIYASWIREAVSAATGEDHHEMIVVDAVPLSVGHMILPGTLTFT